MEVKHSSQPYNYRLRTTKEGKIPEINETERKEILLRFINKAPLEDGHAEAFCMPKDIPWYDEHLFQEGRQFALDYYAVIILLMLFQSTGGPAFRPVGSVLFRNWNFYPNFVFHVQLLHVIRRMKSWFDHDMTDEQSEAVKHFKFTRHVHDHFARKDLAAGVLPLSDIQVPMEYHKLAEILRKDISSAPPATEDTTQLFSWNPDLGFSQLNVAVIQVGFFSFFWLSPLMAPLITDGQRLAFTHYWAVIGRMLGVKDEFNLCLYPDTELFQRFIANHGTIVLSQADPTSAMFMKQCMDGVGGFFYIPGNVVLFMAMQELGVKGERCWGLLRWWEKLMVYLIKLVIPMYFRWKQLRNVANWVFKKYLDRLLKIYAQGREFKKENKSCGFL